MTFRVYWDDVVTLTVELKLIYYNGLSNSFKVIDEENNYYETKVLSDKVNGTCRRYKLYAEGLEIGKSYVAVDERFLKTTVEYRYIVRTEHFDQHYYYHGEDLGSTYTYEYTTFKIWSPVASRIIVDIEELGTCEMIRGDKGVFEIVVEGDLDSKAYQYLVNINGDWRAANDPYAFSSTANHQKSVIVNLDKIDDPLYKDTLPILKQKTDAVIYELHVRDWSSKSSSGIYNKGKFLGLVEEETTNNQGDSTGLDYLSDLGITHVQLLPVYDFGSVDEINQMTHYNWGYDPVQYNVPEGSYATNSTDPYSRIVELRKMVAGLHAKGLRVVMDVVYNHMFDRFSSDFEKLVPYYYFRIGTHGEQSNGSFCGNDIDSTRLMMRKYILESIKRWMKLYGMDGFRFDLMGILDIETMNQVASLVNKIDNNAIVYGEGWNMPTLLNEAEKATMMNQEKMPGISHFNDYFRDAIKGDTMLDRIKKKGFMTGNSKHLSRLPNLILGSKLNAGETPFFTEPWKSINYVECHDNHTSYDKMLAADVIEEERLSRQKLMLAAVIFSRGIPFIQAGQEMCRTKGGDHNSYKSPDHINGIDWNLRTVHKKLIQYVKDALTLRKNTPEFRVMTYDEKTIAVIDKHHHLVQLDYTGGTKMILNLGHHIHKLKLIDEKIVFNGAGAANISGESYKLQPLELIVVNPL